MENDLLINSMQGIPDGIVFKGGKFEFEIVTNKNENEMETLKNVETPLYPSGIVVKNEVVSADVWDQLTFALQTEFQGRAILLEILNGHSFTYQYTDKNGDKTNFEVGYKFNSAGVMSISWTGARQIETNVENVGMLPTYIEVNQDQKEMTDAEIDRWENSNALIPPEVLLAIHKAKEKRKAIYIAGRLDSNSQEPLLPNFNY